MGGEKVRRARPQSAQASRRHGASSDDCDDEKLENAKWLRKNSSSRPRPSSASAVNVKGKAGVRRRPQSASVQRVKSQAGLRKSGPKKKKTQARPSTAPVHGRSVGKDDSVDNWYDALKRHGLLSDDRPNSASVSQKYLKEARRKKREEDRNLILLTYKEQEQYERGCIARMAEATRWAAALGLGKKFNPILDKPASLTSGKDAASAGIATSESSGVELGVIDRGTLRCEVAMKNDSLSRTISCDMFEREYAKLRVQHRQMLVQEEARKAAESRLQSLDEFGLSATEQRDKSARRTLPSLKDKRRASSLEQRRTLKKGSGNNSNSISSSGSNNNQTSISYERPETNADDAEKELFMVLRETQELTKMLTSQMQLLHQNGWNLR